MTGGDRSPVREVPDSRVPGFPYLVRPHPITSVGPAELDARVRLLAPLARRLLLEGRAGP